ncbi:hypothetical protein EJ03DRAFT_379809 [Teratosphaeria nubilosa]|uniref:RING-type E3 ubiquitin transferase n=1 Tax=Teratosphaeria nubilosa TaxID=161662 RepID=A0A6G1LNQ3_9PEZI|nr:hypothetical protein EJ03DRAFT_379809 [Teratosphaeria nubilosa]
MADRRNSIIPLLIISFIIFTNNGPVRPSSAAFEERPTIEDAIAQEQYHLSVLQNSTYGELRRSDGNWLNLTGLEPERGFAWDGLDAVKEKAGQYLFHAVGEEGKVALDGGGTVSLPLWQNVTGFVHGKWARSRLEETLPRPQLNMSSYSTAGAFGQTVERHFDGNVTGREGDMSVRLRARPQHQYQSADEMAMNVAGISAEMSISHGDYEVEVQVYGTYFMDIGQAIMTTTSDNFAGIFTLPHMALSAHTFNASRTLLNETISRTIKLQKDGDIEHLNPWSPRTGPNEPAIQSLHCELIVYMQQLPPSGLPATSATAPLLSSVENELRFPSGAILPAVPELQFSMLAFSPDCGYFLESKGEPDFVPQDGTHLTGTKIEVLTNYSRHHLIFFALTIGAQLYLLIRQMREASTPSTRSKISYYTIALLALGDGFAAICFVMLSIFIPDVWANLCTVAFLALISVSFFGMRFILDIWTTQAPEREAVARAEAENERQRLERLRAALQRIRADREANRARMATVPEGPPSATTAPPDPAQDDNPPQTSNANAAGAPGLQSHLPQMSMPDSLPPTTTPQAPAAPTDTGATPVFFMPSDQAGLQPTLDPGLPTTNIPTTGPINIEPHMPTFAALYIKFYVLLLLVLFVTSSAISWPASLQKGYFVTLALVYLSPWWPQIYRNAWRNCRHAMEWEYVLGQSALRLVPFAYFFAYPHNIIFAVRDIIALAVLGGWIWIQVCVLVSQEIVGPRWFVKESWVPEAYDYHPVLREDEEEGSTMPIGFSEASATSVPSSPSLERRGSLSREAKEKGKGKRIFDCAICMQDLEVPVIEAGQSGAGEGALGGATPTRIRHTPSTEPSTLSEGPTEDPLDSSLHHLAEAVAALRSAGPHYHFLCEGIWVFVAGSWRRGRWETAVWEARKALDGGVRRALEFAGERFGEAVGLLEADERSFDSSSLFKSTADLRLCTSRYFALFFPTLSPDGSVEELPRYYDTPPAALSSLGARLRMADPLSASTSSLADSQYDMIDDLSEISNEDQETASLASTEGRESENEDLVAQPEAFAVDEVGQARLEEQLQSLESNDSQESSDDEHMTPLDSFLSDDLETPRQSTMPYFSRPPKPFSLSASMPDLKSWPQAPRKQAKTILPTVLCLLSMVAAFPLIWTVLSGLPFFQMNPVAQAALRREALLCALEHATTANSSDVTRTVNIEHLLPMPTAAFVDFLGQKTYATQDRARYQTVLPNRVIVSLPRHSGYSRYPSPKTVEVVRGSRGISLASNTTKLIEGVYDISIDPVEAYGFIDIDLTTKNPSTNHTLPTNFGNRMLQRTDISKAVNKDLKVARKAANDLAVTWSRDLQVMAESAVSVYNKAVLFIPSRRTVFASLAASRENALALKEKVRGKGKALVNAKRRARKGNA